MVILFFQCPKCDASLSRYDFPDNAWNIISSMLPTSHHSDRPYLDHRTVMNGIFWVLCSGAPWRNFPEHYGHWKTVYNRFNHRPKLGAIRLFLRKLDN